MKRIITFILALVMLASLLSFGVMAANPTLRVDTVEAKAGEEVTVSIRIQNNPGVASIKLKVAYDPALTLKSITYNSSLGGQSQQPQQLKSPVTLNWYNGAANTNGDMVYATLTFTVSTFAKAGSHPITITYDEDDLYNINEDNINFAIVNGGVTVPAAQTYQKGDVNMDGDISNADLILVARYVVNLTTFDSEEFKLADMDDSGEIDNADVILVARIIVGL